MERSAMSNHQKYQILANELTRRLSNIMDEVVEKEEILEKIEQFSQELRNSGYSQNQAKEIVSSGVRGWQKRIRKRKRDDQNFYRSAKDTLEERVMKDLVERETWYKENDGIDEEPESPKKRMKFEEVDNTKTKNDKKS